MDIIQTRSEGVEWIELARIESSLTLHFISAEH
jgi:hypothetical protein